MSEANDITARLLIEIPKRYRNVRVWRQNTGGGIGMSTVKQAIALLRTGRIASAISLLSSRPIKWGIEGCGDISGILLKDFGFENLAGIRIEIEIKADKDKQSTEQKAFGAMVIAHHGIYIVVRSVDQCLEDLGKWV